MAIENGVLVERDIFGAPFSLGTYVNVRCKVTAITPNAAGGTGGPADLITLVVQSPGNVGELVGVTFQVTASQIRKAGSTEQA